jgi:hypothetical protein
MAVVGGRSAVNAGADCVELKKSLIGVAVPSLVVSGDRPQADSIVARSE